jgi:hypothetical protein
MPPVRSIETVALVSADRGVGWWQLVQLTLY